MLALRLDEAGALQEEFRLPELEGAYGRIRSVLQGVDGALYLTTDNGGERRTGCCKVTPALAQASTVQVSLPTRRASRSAGSWMRARSSCSVIIAS